MQTPRQQIIPDPSPCLLNLICVLLIALHPPWRVSVLVGPKTPMFRLPGAWPIGIGKPQAVAVGAALSSACTG